MLTAGEETSSPTGTMLSFSSVPNGKKLAGTDGSVRQSTDWMSPPTSSRKSGVDVAIFVTVTLTSLPALSLQHTEVELCYGRRSKAYRKRHGIRVCDYRERERERERELCERACELRWQTFIGWRLFVCCTPEGRAVNAVQTGILYFPILYEAYLAIPSAHVLYNVRQ